MKKALLTYFAMTTVALAHPGHGEAVGHWLTQPDHIAAAVILAVLAVIAGLALTRFRSRE